MCFNCGCGITDDNMGKPDMTGASLTDKSIMEMAKAWNMSVEDTEKEIWKILNKKFKKD